MSNSSTPKFIWLVSSVAALGGLLFGYDLLVISGAKSFYELTFGLDTAAAQGWAVSSCIVGCILGALSVGPLADRFGRTRLLTLSALLFLISAIGSGYAPSFSQFILYRILGGLGMGMASTLSPMYISEIAPSAVRGRLVALNQLTIVVGILLAQLVNFLIANHDPIPAQFQDQSALVADLKLRGPLHIEGEFYQSDLFTPEQRLAITEGQLLDELPADLMQLDQVKASIQNGAPLPTASIQLDALSAHTNSQLSDSWVGTTGWRWMFAAEGLPALLFLVLMFFVPESPRWLISRGRADKAEKNLIKLGGDSYAAQALAEIKAKAVSSEATKDKPSLLSRRLLPVLILGIVIAVFQQWCGINVIFNYAPDIFRDAGFTVGDILFNLVIIGLTNMAFTFVGMALIDRLGRRALFLGGSIGLAICHGLIGVCYATGLTGWYVVGLALLAIATFASSLGPVAWVYLSEIFPNAVRGKAMAIAVFSLWVANFILSFTFPILRESLGPAGTFWIYGGICLIGFFYLLSKAPETKEQSLEEIEAKLGL